MEQTPTIVLDAKNVRRFARQYQTEIFTAALIFLSMKQRGLRSSIGNISEAQKAHLEATRLLEMALTAVDLDVDRLYIRTDLLDGKQYEQAGTINKHGEAIMELRRVVGDMHRQLDELVH